MEKGKKTNRKKIIGFFLVIMMICSLELVFTEEDGIFVKAAKKTIQV